MRLYAELDAVRGATVLNALDAAATRPTRDHAHDRDGDSRGGGVDGAAELAQAWSATSRARQYADALEAVCADWLADDRTRPARPLLVAHVDLSQLHTRTDGTVELAVRGDLPRITTATLEALACSADVRAVVFDGARPLATTGNITARVTRRYGVAAATASTRALLALAERRGAWPRRMHREHGGTHDPDNLISLSRRHHTLTHKHGWRLKITPDTGMVTARRKHRAWRSLPRATPLAPNSSSDDDEQRDHTATHPADPLPF